MAEGFVGEIRIFGGNFAPRHWSLCEGQILAISNNDALYSLIGTIYGGDGVNTFGLPDFRGRIPVHSGNSQGPGLPIWPLGQRIGQENHTLTINEMPAHTHALKVSEAQGDSGTPFLNFYGKTDGTDKKYYKHYDPAQTGELDAGAVSSEGESQYHNNMMPSMGLTFIICMQGIYPSRN